MKILHIAAHVGGGIGSAYIGLGDCGQKQTILLLEKPIDLFVVEKVEAAGFRIVICADEAVIRQELEQTDLVLFNWTHHPALTKFLYQFPSIPIRSILWCHVSGNYFPYISGKFVQKFDHGIFATPYSLDLPQIQALGSRCSVVYGLSDLTRFSHVERKPHRSFIVGYVGTFGFCKLHPDYVDFCAAVPMDDVRFAMAGQPTTKEALLKDAQKRGMEGRFYFYGQMPDVVPALEEMDAFAYLLNPQHFGATENALLEAMAAGLPVVALDQCVERIIIRDGKTGLLVHSMEEFGKAIQYLHDHPKAAAQLGAQARDEVLQRFAIQQNRERFLNVCRNVIEHEKRVHKFSDFFSGQPADWFLTGINADRECFEENRPQDAGLIFRERTKGSPVHYHAYFPKDKRLAYWSKKLK